MTPNNFLFGRANPGSVFGGMSGRIEGALPLSRRWQYVQQLVQHFWVRWQREVLHSYRTRSKWLVDRPNLKMRDAVMVLEIIDKHNKSWRLGKVMSTLGVMVSSE